MQVFLQIFPSKTPLIYNAFSLSLYANPFFSSRRKSFVTAMKKYFLRGEK